MSPQVKVRPPAENTGASSTASIVTAVWLHPRQSELTP
jgi:hypothetical protein